MKLSIQLKNFMCHTSKTFDFNECGLHLLEGLNGCGKSTILKAIYFVLYGKARNVYSHSLQNKNKKGCCVKLEWLGLSITRTRSPNTLVLIKLTNNKRYEDDSAQFIINETLGMNEQEFLISTFIRPNSRSSLITMTPSEQLKIFETIAYDDDLHTKHKIEITKMVKERNEKLILAKGKSEMSTHIHTKELNNFENKNYQVTNPTSFDENELTYLQHEYEKSSKILRDLYSNERASKEAELRLKEELLCPYKGMEEWSEFSLEELKSVKSKIDEKNHIQTKVDEFEILKDEYFKECEDELKKISPFILSEEKLKEYSDSIRVYNSNTIRKKIFKKECDDIQSKNKDLSDLNFLKNNSQFLKKIDDKLLSFTHIYDKIKKDILNDDECLLHNKELSKVKKCPKCKVQLMVDGGEIKESCMGGIKEVLKVNQKNDLKKDHKKYLGLMSDINKLKISYDNYSNIVIEDDEEGINNKRKWVEHHLMHITKFKSLKKNIETKTLSAFLIKMQKGIPLDPLKYKIPPILLNKITLKFHQFDKVGKFGVDKLTSKIEWLVGKVQKYRDCKKIMDELSIEIAVIKKILSTFQNEETVENVVKRVDEYQIKIKELNKQKELDCKYKLFKDHLMRVEELSKEKEQSQREYERFEMEYTSSLTLQTKQHLAEILSMENVVNCINEMAKVYLDLFFENEPIFVKCNILKKTKIKQKIKFEINTTIFYKGSDYSSYTDLSQGELVKVNLSYILAMNEYHNSKMLLLDEFLENLDTEIIDNITLKLREISKNKCIIIINHGAVKGLYDYIVTL